jgi:hypothetical protein
MLQKRFVFVLLALLVTVAPETFRDRNTISNISNVLIGRVWSTTMQVVLKSLMNTRSGLIYRLFFFGKVTQLVVSLNVKYFPMVL